MCGAQRGLSEQPGVGNAGLGGERRGGKASDDAMEGGAHGTDITAWKAGRLEQAAVSWGNAVVA